MPVCLLTYFNGENGNQRESGPSMARVSHSPSNYGKGRSWFNFLFLSFSLVIQYCLFSLILVVSRTVCISFYYIWTKEQYLRAFPDAVWVVSVEMFGKFSLLINAIKWRVFESLAISKFQELTEFSFFISSNYGT